MGARISAKELEDIFASFIEKMKRENIQEFDMGEMKDLQPILMDKIFLDRDASLSIGFESISDSIENLIYESQEYGCVSTLYMFEKLALILNLISKMQVEAQYELISN